MRPIKIWLYRLFKNVYVKVRHNKLAIHRCNLTFFPEYIDKLSIEGQLCDNKRLSEEIERETNRYIGEEQKCEEIERKNGVKNKAFLSYLDNLNY